jgi:hypothetical protein
MNKPLIGVLIAIAILGGWMAVRAWMRKSPRLSGQGVADDMKRRAEIAVEEANNTYGIVLDFSRDSVQRVDEILGKLHDEHAAASIERQRLVKESLKWGAYIGEVIRRDQPSHWEMDSKVAGKGSLPIVFERKQREECFPIGWCYKRIVSGPEDNVWHKFLFSTSRIE